MNKGQLVAALAAQTGSTKVIADEMLNAFIAIVQKTLKKGDVVNIPGFGKFYTRVSKKERVNRNPQTGEVVGKTKAGAKSPAFKPGQGLKDIY
jgi:DNA-binding protein HU-beta